VVTQTAEWVILIGQVLMCLQVSVVV
jgi:hypothetical protein